MISRERSLIPPRGSTEILVGDHLFVVVNRESRPPVDRVFARSRGGEQPPLRDELPLRGTATAGGLAEIYGIQIGEPPELTLERLTLDRTSEIEVGTTVDIGSVRLRVREMRDGRIVSVGVAPAEDLAAS